MSVLAQTCPPFEIIVIDDGSTDETAQMMEQEFPAIPYHHQENQGVSQARNTGILKSTGDWLAFLDSDDEWLPDKLNQQTLALLSNPTFKVCHTEEIWIRNQVRINPPRHYAKQGGWLFKACLPLCAISPSTVLLHRSILTDVGVFDPQLPVCEDYDLWLRISAKYPVLLIEDAQIKKHGGHADQLSQSLWGMDRFRIQGLEKIILTEQLSEDNQHAAIQMLLKKADIYLKGLNKRGKLTEAAYYQDLLTRYAVYDRH